MSQCRACGAPLEGSACKYCGQPAAAPSSPTDVGGRPTDLPCPRCENGQTLVARSVEGTAVDACPGCGGLWFDHLELQRALQNTQGVTSTGRAAAAGARQPQVGRPAHESTVRYLRCPRCMGLMDRQNWQRSSGVIVDACITHGYWLDAGELEALRGHAAMRPAAHGAVSDFRAAFGNSGSPGGALATSSSMAVGSAGQAWTRPQDDRVLSGTCLGIARRLGCPAEVIRFGFVILAFGTGFIPAAILYAILTAAMTDG